MKQNSQRVISSLALAAIILTASLQASFHKALEVLHSDHEHTYFSDCPTGANIHEHHPHADCELCEFLNGKPAGFTDESQSTKFHEPEARSLFSDVAELPFSARLSNLVPRGPPVVGIS